MALPLIVGITFIYSGDEIIDYAESQTLSSVTILVISVFVLFLFTPPLIVESEFVCPLRLGVLVLFWIAYGKLPAIILMNTKRGRLKNGHNHNLTLPFLSGERG